MSSRSNSLDSYIKSTVASLALVALGLILALFALYWLPAFVGPVLAGLGVLAALGAATFACAGAVVLVRHRRGTRGQRDLFLELNRSREPAALKAAGPRRITALRRWLARHLLGHDFIVGDLVEVRPWTEIRAMLDEHGTLEQLPFMPEMLAMCGRRAYVFRSMHRLFDYRKTRRMRHMNGAVLLVETVCDGSSHGSCEAACHTIWKAAWLRRVDRTGSLDAVPSSAHHSNSPTDTAVLLFGTQPPRYSCQLTQLHAASQPIGEWSAANFLRPVISGNVTLAAFLVGWLTYAFNELQHWRQGVGFPTFDPAVQGGNATEEIRLRPGDQVRVRPSAEIRATLNDQMMHRGMWFEPDMLKHCGRPCQVQSEVSRLIDIVTGEIRTMKTPAYMLRDTHFSGERQLFNTQYEPLFWRSAWLRRDAH